MKAIILAAGLGKRLGLSDIPKPMYKITGKSILEYNILLLKKHNIKMMSMNQLFENIEDSCDILMEFSKDKELYISININFVDPTFAPSTAYPETGGLTSRQFLYIIQRMNKIKNLKAVDIVEINEKEDKVRGNATVKLGAKIISELI